MLVQALPPKQNFTKSRQVGAELFQADQRTAVTAISRLSQLRERPFKFVTYTKAQPN